MLRYVTLRWAMLRLLCYTMLRCTAPATLFYAVLSAVLRHDTLCYAMLVRRYATSYNNTPHVSTILSYAVLRRATMCYAIPRCAALYYAMLPYARLCYELSYAMLPCVQHAIRSPTLCMLQYDTGCAVVKHPLSIDPVNSHLVWSTYEATVVDMRTAKPYIPMCSTKPPCFGQTSIFTKRAKSTHSYKSILRLPD